MSINYILSMSFHVLEVRLISHVVQVENIPNYYLIFSNLCISGLTKRYDSDEILFLFSHILKSFVFCDKKDGMVL